MSAHRGRDSYHNSRAPQSYRECSRDYGGGRSSNRDSSPSSRSSSQNWWPNTVKGNSAYKGSKGITFHSGKGNQQHGGWSDSDSEEIRAKKVAQAQKFLRKNSQAYRDYEAKKEKDEEEQRTMEQDNKVREHGLALAHAMNLKIDEALKSVVQPPQFPPPTSEAAFLAPGLPQQQPQQLQQLLTQLLQQCQSQGLPQQQT